MATTRHQLNASPLDRLLDYVDDLDDILPESAKYILDEMDAHIEAVKQLQLSREDNFRKEEDKLHARIKAVRSEAVAAENKLKSELEKELNMMASYARGQEALVHQHEVKRELYEDELSKLRKAQANNSFQKQVDLISSQKDKAIEMEKRKRLEIEKLLSINKNQLAKNEAMLHHFKAENSKLVDLTTDLEEALETSETRKNNYANQLEDMRQESYHLKALNEKQSEEVSNLKQQISHLSLTQSRTNASRRRRGRGNTDGFNNDDDNEDDNFSVESESMMTNVKLRASMRRITELETYVEKLKISLRETEFSVARRLAEIDLAQQQQQIEEEREEDKQLVAHIKTSSLSPPRGKFSTGSHKSANDWPSEAMVDRGDRDLRSPTASSSDSLSSASQASSKHNETSTTRTRQTTPPPSPGKRLLSQALNTTTSPSSSCRSSNTNSSNDDGELKRKSLEDNRKELGQSATATKRSPRHSSFSSSSSSSVPASSFSSLLPPMFSPMLPVASTKTGLRLGGHRISLSHEDMSEILPNNVSNTWKSNGGDENEDRSNQDESSISDDKFQSVHQISNEEQFHQTKAHFSQHVEKLEKELNERKKDKMMFEGKVLGLEQTVEMLRESLTKCELEKANILHERHERDRVNNDNDTFLDEEVATALRLELNESKVENNHLKTILEKEKKEKMMVIDQLRNIETQFLMANKVSDDYKVKEATLNDSIRCLKDEIKTVRNELMIAHKRQALANSSSANEKYEKEKSSSSGSSNASSSFTRHQMPVVSSRQDSYHTSAAAVSSHDSSSNRSSDLLGIVADDSGTVSRSTLRHQETSVNQQSLFDDQGKGEDQGQTNEESKALRRQRRKEKKMKSSSSSNGAQDTSSHKLDKGIVSSFSSTDMRAKMKPPIHSPKHVKGIIGKNENSFGFQSNDGREEEEEDNMFIEESELKINNSVQSANRHSPSRSYGLSPSNVQEKGRQIYDGYRNQPHAEHIDMLTPDFDIETEKQAQGKGSGGREDNSKQFGKLITVKSRRDYSGDDDDRNSSGDGGAYDKESKYSDDTYDSMHK